MTTDRLQNSDRLIKLISKTALPSKSFLRLAPQAFNTIPNSITSLDINNFKCKLKSILTDKCYYNLDTFPTDNHFRYSV